jgi:hypothetical protein
MMTPEKYKTLKIDKTSHFDAVVNEDIMREIATKHGRGISDTFKFILQETHAPLGQWKQNPKCEDVMFGVVINGRWHRLNTPETNTRGQFFLFKRCNIFLNLLKEKGEKFIIIKNRKISTDKIFINHNWDKDENTESKIRDLLFIIWYNANEWLVPNNPVCDELMEICYECMLIGDTAEFICQMYLHKIHNDIKSYKFTEGLGDCRDIKQGIDCWIYDSNDVLLTYQIKHGYFTMDENFVKTKSNFSKVSKCDYFIIVYKNNMVIIKNDKNNTKIKSDWTFPITNCEKFNIINMVEELKNLMRITEHKDIKMKLTKEGEDNFINYNEEEKTITINFPNDDDKLFNEKIKEQTTLLKQRFQ